MKKVFTRDYILDNRGCYNKEQVEAVLNGQDEITIYELLEKIPLEDFVWFVSHKTNVNQQASRFYLVQLVEIVEPIYRKQYPDDDRVSKCIEATKSYLNGEISIDQLKDPRINANAAAANAANAYANATAANAANTYAKAAAANAASAAANANAAYVTNAADAVTFVAKAAANAAAYADTAAAHYTKKIQSLTRKFIEQQS